MSSIQSKSQESQVAQRRGRGFEEPTQREDLIIPRVKLMQALSPEVIEDGSALKPGQIINSVTREILPAEFVPVFKYTEFFKFNPRNQKDADFDPSFEAGAVVWRTRETADPRVIAGKDFGPNGQPPSITKFLNFFSYFPGSETMSPVVLGFAKTSMKAGQQLMSLCKLSQTQDAPDMFSWKYRLGAKVAKNDKGTYYVFTVTKVGRSSSDEFAFAEQLWEEFHDKSIKTHEEGQTDDEEGNPPF